MGDDSVMNNYEHFSLSPNLGKDTTGQKRVEIPGKSRLCTSSGWGISSQTELKITNHPKVILPHLGLYSFYALGKVKAELTFFDNELCFKIRRCPMKGNNTAFPFFPFQKGGIYSGSSKVNCSSKVMHSLHI